MPRWSLNSEELVDKMERQSEQVESELRRVLRRHGLTLSAEGEEGFHGAIMEAVGSALEAEGALEFLDDHGREVS